MKLVIKTLVSILICNLTFLGIAFLVSRIPYSWIEDNVRESAVYFDTVESCEKKAGVFVFELGDRNQIDVASRMNSFKDAIVCPWNNHDVTQTNNLLKNDNIRSYGRYWHGTPMMLRVLLIFFSVTQIRVLCLICYIAVTILVLYKIQKKLGIRVTIAYMLSSIMIESYGYALTILTFPIWLISSIGILLVLSGRHINYTVIACITVFFDFLSCEVVTLCMPLIFSFLLYGTKSSIRKTIQKSEEYGVAYILTFLIKFLLVYLFVGNLNDVILGLQNRFEVQSANVFTDMLNALYFNLRFLFPLKFVSDWRIVLAILGVVLILLIKCMHKDLQPYLMVLLIPVLRYCVLSNHSLMHSFYTYRILEISVFVCWYVILRNFRFKFGIQFFR